MKTLDDLIIQRDKLTELVKTAKMFGGSVNIGDETVSLTELTETLDNVKIEIETRRSNQALKKII